MRTDNESNQGNRKIGTVHWITAVFLAALYLLGFTCNFFYVNLLCYYEDEITHHQEPCDLTNDVVATVWSSSIAGLISTTFEHNDYDKSISLLFLGIILPFVGIGYNLRCLQLHASKEKEPILPCKCFKRLNDNNPLWTYFVSIIFALIHKAPINLLFGCILFINAYYQSMSSPNNPLGTLYQEVVVHADIGTNILIVGVIISSIWTVYIHFDHKLYNYNPKEYTLTQKRLIILLALLALTGIFGAVTYFFSIDFIKMVYNDDWGLYHIYFHDKDRQFNFINIMNRTDDILLTFFYYLYVVIMPILCFFAFIGLFVLVKKDKKIQFWMFIFIVFASCNGIDYMLCTVLMMVILIPWMWGKIIYTIYGQFCKEIGSNFCDAFTLKVSLLMATLIGWMFLLLLIATFVMYFRYYILNKTTTKNNVLIDKVNNKDKHILINDNSDIRVSQRGSINSISTNTTLHSKLLKKSGKNQYLSNKQSRRNRKYDSSDSTINIDETDSRNIKQYNEQSISKDSVIKSKNKFDECLMEVKEKDYENEYENADLIVQNGTEYSENDSNEDEKIENNKQCINCNDKIHNINRKKYQLVIKPKKKFNYNEHLMDNDIDIEIEDDDAKMEYESECKSEQIVNTKNIMSVDEFKSISLKKCFQKNNKMDNFDIARNICKYYDELFNDKDTVCLVSNIDIKPKYSVCMENGYERIEILKDKRKYILVYRSQAHDDGRNINIENKAFKSIVKGLSMDNNNINDIMQQMNQLFGNGCHVIKCKKKSFDVYSRYTKFHCQIKVPNTNDYIVAWKR
eukprot:467638_1